MSNTSYSFKEKSQELIVIQGGDKKVMKKILSVALSTAMAFSMFASVAFGDDTALTPQQKYDALKAKGVVEGLPDGLAHLEKTLTRAELAKIIVLAGGLTPVEGVFSYKDKNYTKHWAASYIEAVTAAGIMEGTSKTSKLFNPGGTVTVQELAAVLQRALKLELADPATKHNAADWAQGYIEAAINAGFVEKGLDYKLVATRSQAIVAAYAVDEFVSIAKIVSYKVIDSKNIEFTLSDKEVVKVELKEALEANKETEVTFEYKGHKYSYKVTNVVTTATKVEKVAASNLKEVVVTFDGKVDEETATEKGNYSLKSGKAIKSVALSSDETTVTITLADATTLANNKADALTVNNVKAGDKVVSASNFEFTTVDNVLPTVDSIKSLGTKSVKVVFSEPVVDLKQSNFTIDGKEYFGKVDAGAGNRSVILTPYSSILTVGDHKIAVSGVKDYAGFVSLNSTHDFTVVEDKDAPTIAEATATLESVTITFSEDVDASTVSRDNVYWKSGSDKKTADSFEQLADNKYKFYFDAETKSLPTGSVAIYVDGVKDYSGNAIASGASVLVTPVIDQVRPEVKKVEATDSKTIKLTLSKAILSGSVTDTNNYTVKDKDGKAISVESANLDATNSKVVIVKLYTALSTGTNTIAVKNLKDNTKLQNTMLDFSSNVTLGDTDAPTIDSSVVNAGDLRVVVKFNEKMDVESLTNFANYLVKINGKQQSLTSNIASISVLQDQTAVAITFAETINGKVTRLSASGDTTYSNVEELTVLAVKDASGIVLEHFTEQDGHNVIDTTESTTVGVADYDSDAAHAGKKAKLTGEKTLKVKFNAGINASDRDAFVVKVNGVTQTISSVDVDGSSIVTLNVKDALPHNADKVTIDVYGNKITTIAGVKANSAVGITNAIADTAIIDGVAPSVTGIENTGAEEITVTFSEPITGSTATPALLKQAVEVTRVSTNKLLDADSSDYSVTVSGNTLVITLLDGADRTANTAYKVEVKADSRIKDAGSNSVKAFTKTSAQVASQANLDLTAARAGVNNVTHTHATNVVTFVLPAGVTLTKVSGNATVVGGVVTVTLPSSGTETVVVKASKTVGTQTADKTFTITADATVVTTVTP